MIQRIQNSKWVFVLISVFLAVIFWMYVRNDLDPPGSRTIYNVPVTLTGETILESQGLTITAVSDTAVDLKITAPISILNKLSNRNLSVTVNVSQCTEGEQILQYDVNWPRDVSTAEITKESQEPAAITVMVARLYSKTFEIQPVLKASIAPGYQAGQITISPETVTISGGLQGGEGGGGAGGRRAQHPLLRQCSSRSAGRRRERADGSGDQHGHRYHLCDHAGLCGEGS